MRASRRQAAPLVALMPIGTRRAPAGINSGARGCVCACVRACVCACVWILPCVTPVKEKKSLCKIRILLHARFEHGTFRLTRT